MIDFHKKAHDLRRRLNDHGVDIEVLATEAAAVFDAAKSAIHVHWLELELGGYGSVEGQAALHEVLGVNEGDRLVVHVSSYRLQRGQITEQGELTGKQFQHFFVEPIRELTSTANRVRQWASGQLRLTFEPSDVPAYPIEGIFPSDVFERMLLGFRAVLHLQLGSLVT